MRAMAHRLTQRALGIGCAAALSFVAPRAGAQSDVERDPWADPWKYSASRFFFGARVDVGYPFMQARLRTGYGKPHYFWGGLEAGPLATTTAGAAFGGVRFESPFLDLRSDIMYTASFRHSFLEPLGSYERRDLDDREGGKAAYLAWDSEADIKVPIFWGTLRSETEGVHIPEEDGRYVYVETLRVIAAPEWVVRQRLDYEFPLLFAEGLRVSPAAEVLWNPGRDDALVWRAGLLVRWWLFDDLELRIDALPVVASPDSLGSRGGDPLRIGVRWQWATGE